MLGGNYPWGNFPPDLRLVLRSPTGEAASLGEEVSSVGSGLEVDAGGLATRFLLLQEGDGPGDRV